MLLSSQSLLSQIKLYLHLCLLFRLELDGTVQPNQANPAVALQLVHNLIETCSFEELSSN